MSARSRATTLAIAMAVTFVMMRAYLHLSPNTDLTIAGYNIHHLFTGLILITLGGIAAVVMPSTHRYTQTAVTIFGVGLALALDEWLYLIVTDGTNASYLLPVSLWGGFAAVALAVVYAMLIFAHRTILVRLLDAARNFGVGDLDRSRAAAWPARHRPAAETRRDRNSSHGVCLG